jgi:hypothetical protein
VGAFTIKRNAERIVYVSRAVKADRNSRVRAEAQLKQLFVDQHAIRLNGATASLGQPVRKTSEQGLKDVSGEKKRFTAVQDDRERVPLVFV